MANDGACAQLTIPNDTIHLLVFKVEDVKMDRIFDKQTTGRRPAGIYHILLLLIPFLLVTGRIFAQKENNVWAFGNYIGLDFNSGSPVLFNTAIHQLEGSASVSDKDGNLLMYADGYTVWNRNHTVMPNGTGLSPLGTTSSTSQACVLVRSAENSNRYYLFSLEDCTFQKLYYSIIDLTLDGGLGDVVPGQKMILLTDSVSEKMSIASTACRTWLMVRSMNANQFKAFEINATGLNTTPVVSTIGSQPLDAYKMGTLKFSPDNKQMVCVEHLFSAPGYSAVELYDFNFATGSLSNVRALDLNYEPGVNAYYYDACFSPDNSKLYVTKTGKLVQYDLSLPTLANIIASRTELVNAEGYMLLGVEAGPDDKVYVSEHPSRIHRIENPNLAGVACQLTIPFLTVAPPMGLGGLPNKVVRTVREKTGSHQVLSSCTALTLSAIDEASEYTWNTGAGSKTITAAASGVYWVSYSNNCYDRTDSFYVSILPELQPELGGDVILCKGSKAAHTLNSHLPAAYSVLWNTGSQAHTLSVTQPGVYSIKVTTPGCEGMDSVTVTEQHCDCVIRAPNAFSPNGDGLNDLFQPFFAHCSTIREYVFKIYNRWGQCVFTAYNVADGWNGTYKGYPADAGSYMYDLTYYVHQEEKALHAKGDLVLIR